MPQDNDGNVIGSDSPIACQAEASSPNPCFNRFIAIHIAIIGYN